MKRPEYEFLSFFAKIDYFLSLDKMNYKLVPSSSNKIINIDYHAIIKDQSSLEIHLKKGNHLIICNLKKSKIIAEEETVISIYKSFSGTIDSESFVQLTKKSIIKGDITCARIQLGKSIFNKNIHAKMDGQLTLKPAESKSS